MFEFVEVKKTTDDVKNLYKLLEQRSFQNISHKNLPGFEEHKTFVEKSSLPRLVFGHGSRSVRRERVFAE